MTYIIVIIIPVVYICKNDGSIPIGCPPTYMIYQSL